MYARVFLIGAVCFYNQVFAADVYVAELMVESSVTLDAEAVLSSLSTASFVIVTDNRATHAITLGHNELVAECLIFGDESTCNCSKGYIWSREVCQTYNCCREATCAQNVAHMTPLCVAKVKEDVYVAELMVESNDTLEAETVLSALNGTRDLVVTDNNGVTHTVILVHYEMAADSSCFLCGKSPNSPSSPSLLNFINSISRRRQLQRHLPVSQRL
ncbi:adhesion G protein-coupled receptor F4 [Xyrichtys novacula]|uniref:Adhesion G protein-coupled receptor F4 n=1 Tax=Xyrichtys novacula TaxID=13765 RepID=A0AAV1H009_XYRNO|nr:adhesion G protein-coupled receptor F4 [Xyrichtys novacula]